MSRLGMGKFSCTVPYICNNLNRINPYMEQSKFTHFPYAVLFYMILSNVSASKIYFIFMSFLGFIHIILSNVSAGDDATVKIWDGAQGQLLYSFNGHGYPDHSINF